MAGRLRRPTDFDRMIPVDDWDWRTAKMEFQKISETLEHKNRALTRNGIEMVRVPKIPGRIFIKDNKGGTSDVEYIYEKWYDKSKKQNRNRKVKIGVIFPEVPNGMIALDRYYDFFDVATGKLKEQKPEISEEELITEYEDAETEDTQEQDQEPETAEREPGTIVEEAEDLIEESGKNETAESEVSVPEESVAEIQEAITEESENGAEEAEPLGHDASETISGPEKVSAEPQTTKEEKVQAQSRNDMLDEILKIYKGDMAKAKRMLAQSDKEKRIIAEEMMRMLGSAGTANRMALDGDGRTSGIDSMDGTEADREYERIKWIKDRFYILFSIVKEMQETIRTLAKKQPDGLINSYKARNMNKILSEVRQREEKTGMADLLELIQEPHEEEQNGETVIVGTSYSDAEIILDHYYAVMYHTSGNERLYEK